MADKTEVADASGDVQPGQLGLGLRPLTRDERKDSGIDQGLVIENVAGPAARAGIETGDVLLAINGRPVTSIDQVKSVLAGKPQERCAAGATRRATRSSCRSSSAEESHTEVLIMKAWMRNSGATFAAVLAAAVTLPSKASPLPQEPPVHASLRQRRDRRRRGPAPAGAGARLFR
jgi:hypothetical protein